jgi:hypothetical protein
MRKERAELAVAVLGSYGRQRCDYDRLRARAYEIGLQGDGAIVVRLDRVVIELLLREHLTSTETREEIIPLLLAQRVLLSWWRPGTSPDASSAAMGAVAEVLCAVLVPSVVKVWVMDALTNWEP